MWTTCPSPLGEVRVEARDGAVVAVLFAPSTPPVGPRDDADPLLRQAVRELAEYFAGERRAFDLPLAPAGTPFQQRVWAELRRVPYGATTTYGELAARIGAPGSVRAVGTANGRNPVAVVVPCHRVIGSDGNLRGYAGGLDRKLALLALERGPGADTLF